MLLEQKTSLEIFGWKDSFNVVAGREVKLAQEIFVIGKFDRPEDDSFAEGVFDMRCHLVRNGFTIDFHRSEINWTSDRPIGLKMNVLQK